MFGDSFGFEDLFNQLAGGITRTGYQKQNSGSNNLLDFIEERKKKYFIFDFSGKEVLDVQVKDNLEENEYGEMVHDGQKVLEIKFKGENKLKFVLPKKTKSKHMSYTFENGILEVVFEK